MRTAAAIPAIGLIAGCALGLLVPEVQTDLGYLALSASAVAAVCAWRRSRALALVLAAGAAFLIGGAMLSAGAWREAWRPSLRLAFEAIAREQRAEAAAKGRMLPEDDEAFVTVRGVLRADAAPSPSGVSLSVRVDQIEGQEGSARGPRPRGRVVEGGILVTVVGSLAISRIEQWRAGRHVRMPVQLRRPARYLNPGLPDEERALARRDTTLVGSVKSGALVEVVDRGRWWDERAADVRAFARRAIAAEVGGWSRPSSAIVAAIVIGDRAGLDDDVQRRMQEAGTYHVIAISGGNIAILAGLMLAAFRSAGMLGRGAMFSAIVWLIGYARLVGGGASVDRATLMAVVYFAGRLVDQRSPPLNTLWAVAAILVAADPLVVLDPAFVLTFGATFAILTVVPVVVRERWPAAFKGLAAMFAASLAAEAVLFPVSASVFSRVTFAGLALNFLAIPLMSIAQIAGLALLPVALISPRLALVPGFIAHVGAAGLVWSAGLARLVPVLSYRVVPPTWMCVSFYYLGAVSAWVLWRRRTTVWGSGEPAWAAKARWVGVVVSAAAAVWILAEPWRFGTARGGGRLRVTFLDVGQGDSAFIQFPRGETMLVDTGGLTSSASFDIGERVVAPVIRRSGARRLDYLVLSHGDPDHIGGALSILHEFPPREVWEGIPVPRSALLTALRLKTQALGRRWANVYAGDRVSIDGVEVASRHPRPADWERQRVRNDDSLVVELRWNDVSILLAGDVGKAAERAMASAIPASPLRVVKVPHHGSLTSSSPEFLRAVDPQVAVFSAGRDNRFGHPAAAVVERYRAIGAAVFRTDQDGAVTVETDGHSIDVHTFTGRTIALRQTQHRSHEAF